VGSVVGGVTNTVGGVTSGVGGLTGGITLGVGGVLGGLRQKPKTPSGGTSGADAAA
jgi:phage-related protein